jgi:hypothetical protein
MKNANYFVNWSSKKLVWEKKGEAAESGEFSEFLEALRKAEADAVITNVKVITRAAQEGVGEQPLGF